MLEGDIKARELRGWCGRFGGGVLVIRSTVLRQAPALYESCFMTTGKTRDFIV
jgi:hypothetical protein